MSITAYPYSVVPQARSPHVSTPSGCITCPPDVSIQTILFDQTSLAVIKGWETKSTTDLREFFQPIEGYLEYQFTLKQMTSDEHVTINYGMFADEGITFLMVLPLWHLSNVDFSDIKLNWRYKGYLVYEDDNSDGFPDALVQDPYGTGVENQAIYHQWDELGRILMLSGTTTKPIRPIELQNLSGDDVILKILIAR